MTRRRTISIAAALLALVAMPLALLAHGHGHVKGTVSTVDASKIDVKTADGKSRQLALTGKTKYLKGEAAATIADVKPGERVVVHLAEDGSALEVHLGPAQAAGSEHKH
jgi:hypothetical protein